MIMPLTNINSFFHKVAFQGFSSYLLATETSLKDLNGRLEKPVTMNNFRPNIVVANEIPFDEVKSDSRN